MTLPGHACVTARARQCPPVPLLSLPVSLLHTSSSAVYSQRLPPSQPYLTSSQQPLTLRHPHHHRCHFHAALHPGLTANGPPRTRPKDPAVRLYATSLLCYGIETPGPLLAGQRHSLASQRDPAAHRLSLGLRKLPRKRCRNRPVHHSRSRALRSDRDEVDLRRDDTRYRTLANGSRGTALGRILD